MKIKAEGQARHRFWGEYSAHIGLFFGSKEDAEMAIPILNAGMSFGRFYTAGGGYTESIGWHTVKHGQGEASRAVLVEVAEPALSRVIARLVSFGAIKKDILSCSKSIDYGLPFHVEIEVGDKDQTKLDL